MAIDRYSRSRPPSPLALEVEELLMRFPNLMEEELAKLINMLPHVPILDYGLMTADDDVSQKLTEFRRCHGSRLKPPVGSVIAFLAVPVVLALLLLWWALFGPTGM